MKKYTLFLALLFWIILVSQSLYAQELKKIETYYDDGKIKEQYLVDEKGLKQGSYTLYYHNGNTHMLIEFKDGIKSGKFTSWYINGKVKEESSFLENRKQRKYVFYDELGNVLEEGK